MHQNLAACTPQFTEYTRRLCRLRTLAASGQDENAEAERLRDEMDVLWRRLTSADLDRLDALALDLSHVGIDRDYSGTVPDALELEFRAIVAIKDFDGALRFLRENEVRLPRHDVAVLRGVFWADLGQYAPAAVFLSDAIRLRPGDSRVQALYFRSLLNSAQPELARSQALRMIDRTQDPYVLLLAADVLFDCLGWHQDPARETELRLIIQLAARGIKDLPETPTDSWRSAIASSALFSKALSHELLGEAPEAIAAAAEGEQLAPLPPAGAVAAQVDKTVEGNGRFHRQVQERRRMLHDAIVLFPDPPLCAA